MNYVMVSQMNEFSDRLSASELEHLALARKQDTFVSMHLRAQ